MLIAAEILIVVYGLTAVFVPIAWGLRAGQGRRRRPTATT